MRWVDPGKIIALRKVRAEHVVHFNLLMVARPSSASGRWRPSHRSLCQCVADLLSDSDHFMILAARRVKAGSELLLDYGPKYWNNKGENPEPADHDDGSDADFLG